LRQEGEVCMSNEMIIRVISGILAVIILVVLIQRRRTRVK